MHIKERTEMTVEMLTFHFYHWLKNEKYYMSSHKAEARGQTDV